MTITDSELLRRFSDYIIFEKRLSEKTREAYSREAAFFLDYLGGKGIAPEDARPALIEEYALFRKGEGANERTISRILSSLRCFYSFLSAISVSSVNPASLVPKPREKEHLPKTIGKDEINDLLEAFDKGDPLSLRDYTLFELIYSSGMRISEAIALDVGSYDSRERVISVIGKRDKERKVFIGDIAASALDYYISRIRPLLISKKKKESALFLNRRGERMTRQAAHKRFHEVASGLGMDVTIHTLRHSFASHMIQNGADIRSVQEMLGHSDIKTTQIYTHLDTSSLLSAFDRFSPVSGKKTK